MLVVIGEAVALVRERVAQLQLVVVSRGCGLSLDPITQPAKNKVAAGQINACPQNGLVTMPPSTRSAAPLVALDALEQT